MKIPAFFRVETTLEPPAFPYPIRFEAVLATPDRWEDCDEARDPLGGWRITSFGPLLLAIRFFDAEMDELLAAEDITGSPLPLGTGEIGPFSWN